MVLPRLGTQGGDFPEGGYQPPVIDSIDSRVKIGGVWELKSEVPEVFLQRGRKYVDSFPEKAFVLGVVDVYGGSPCKSGEIISTKVYFVDGLLVPDSQPLVRSMGLHTFYRIYQSRQEFPRPRSMSLRELVGLN